jgi:DNA-directed RNA polymerase subunit RPC12/RpoP
MDTPYLCPDCGDAHDQPGEPALGHQVRCLDCRIEIELAIELRTIVVIPIAA